MSESKQIVVVGLGYVGLPLALALAREFPTVGFDSDPVRIEQLLDGFDRNLEIESQLLSKNNLSFSSDESVLDGAEMVVVTVPTPVTDDKRPDLSMLERASAMVGRSLERNPVRNSVPIIVYESTTYPGCTEEFCGPIIAQESGLQLGIDFLLGYSPERTNFGDAEHTLESITKVVSGQTDYASETIAEVYGKIAKAGVHRASGIKVAEAAKVIENVQRDLNIALFNEAAMIFDRMGINSASVFEAAGTKWNFQRYQPGLVGGHCIPVDPYYLTYAAEQVSYDAKVILAGRRFNEEMVNLVADKVTTMIESTGRLASESSVLVLGQTFKANVADFRNSKAKTLYSILLGSCRSVDSYDPYEDTSLSNDHLFESDVKYDAVILAVGHGQFITSARKIVDLVESNGVLVDLADVFAPEIISNSDVNFWKL